MPGVTMSVYVIVDDVDAHFTRAKAAGTEITREPVTQDYGGRDYTARIRKATSGVSALTIPGRRIDDQRGE
jgi:predicted enzyme related to lactoylglutathione lyase